MVLCMSIGLSIIKIIKLAYRVYIDPNVEEETEDIYSDELKKPASNVYKDIINFYDNKDRLIKHQEYEI